MITKLDVVNHMLAAVGIAKVNTLETQDDDVLQVINIQQGHAPIPRCHVRWCFAVTLPCVRNTRSTEAMCGAKNMTYVNRCLRLHKTDCSEPAGCTGVPRRQGIPGPAGRGRPVPRLRDSQRYSRAWLIGCGCIGGHRDPAR